MAYVERHGNGWRAIWRDGGRGSPKLKGETYLKKSEATAAARAIENQADAKKPLKPGKVLSWADLIERYKAKLTAKKHTAHGYPEKVGKSLTALVADRKWKTTSDVSPGNVGVLTVSQHRYLKAVLRFAQLENQPVDHRCVRLEKPDRPRKPPAVLYTEDEVAALLARAGQYCADLAAAGHLVATYGHRPESLVKILVSEVELDAKPPVISMEVKSGDRIRHPLTAATVAILRPLVKDRKPTDRILLRPDGEPWKDGDALAMYWYHQVGENVTKDRPGIYHLKRYAITRLLGAGQDVATIASITGHRTPSVILTYARTNDAQQQAAITALEKIGAPQVPPR